MISPRRPLPPTAAAAGLALLALLVVMACGRQGVEAPAPSGTMPAPTSPGLVIGEYDASRTEVVDGDTFRMANGTRVRIASLDTEEVFRDARERRRAEADFDAYARAKQGGSATPVKYPTPAGNAAWDGARALVAAADRIRLERDGADAPEEDPFGRVLAHVVLLDAAGERLFAESMVRSGHSPYFVKYGRSRRHDARLRAAQKEARGAARGIWATEGPGHYPDYDARLAWWRKRADQVDAWRARAPRDGQVDLEAPDAPAQLEQLVGRNAEVFGLVRNRKDDGRPRILWLRHRPKKDFAVVVFEDRIWRALDHGALDRYFVTVSGEVSLFHGRPQIIVTDAGQVSTRRD